MGAGVSPVKQFGHVGRHGSTPFSWRYPAGMMGGDACSSGEVAVAMGLQKLTGLQLELIEIWTGWQGSGRHTRSFRERPVSACGPKEAVLRI